MARILIVDDSWFARSAIGKILKADGHEVLEAANGHEAVKMAVSNSPDCIVLDLLMPEMDGFEVLKALKAKGSTIPVVVLTSDIQETTREECIRLGAVGFINKPPKNGELDSVIREVIAPKRETGQFQPTSEHLDALTELINIGAGRAASVLNTMLTSNIRLHVPSVKILSLQESKRELEALGQKPVAALSLAFNGDLAGMARLVFPPEDATKLVTALTGDEPGDLDLDAIRAGTLTEIGNITLNGVLGSISNLLRLSLKYSVPNFFELGRDNLLPKDFVWPGWAILLAHTHFLIEKNDINGDIIIFFGMGSLNKLLDTIDKFSGETENVP